MKRVRAVIIKDAKVLTIKRTKSNETYWVIPGGGVEDKETNEEALVREAKEELGIDIKIDKLILEMDSKKPETINQKEYFYLCNIKGGKMGSGQGPEFSENSKYIGTHDIEWLSIKDLTDFDLRPDDIKDFIQRRSCI